MCKNLILIRLTIFLTFSSAYITAWRVQGEATVYVSGFCGNGLKNKIWVSWRRADAVAEENKQKKKKQETNKLNGI